MKEIKNIVKMEATRTDYSAVEAARKTLTVRELIDILVQFDEDSPIVFSNDNGYTYGNMSPFTVDEIVINDEEED